MIKNGRHLQLPNGYDNIDISWIIITHKVLRRASQTLRERKREFINYQVYKIPASNPNPDI